MNLISRFLLTLLLTGLSLSMLPAQVFLALTPESFLHHQSGPRAGRYHIEANTRFVDALVDAHLLGKLTLYRDFEKTLTFPRQAQFDAYLDQQRRPEWDAFLAEEAKRPLVQDSLEALNARKTTCEACLSRRSRWLLQAGRDSSTLFINDPERRLSLFKQISKARHMFRDMAGVQPNQAYRYLMFTARFDQSEVRTALSWQQGVLLISYYPNGDPSGELSMDVVFFEPDDQDVPWFLLETTPLMAGIQEETSAQALLTESRIDMEPLGYRLPAEGEKGQYEPWESLYRYPAEDTLGIDSTYKDSLRRTWHLENALISGQRLVSLYPRQSKAVSLMLDGTWLPDKPETWPLNEWARDQQADYDWEKTHSMLEQFSQKILSDLSTKQLPTYQATNDLSDLRNGITQTYGEAMAFRDAFALNLLPKKMSIQQARSGETAKPDTIFTTPASMPSAWRDPLAQTYSWRIRGEYIWLQGTLTFHPRWLDLMWEVPIDSVEPYPTVSIEWDDLAAKDYQVDGEPLANVLRDLEYGYYPTQLNATPISDPNHATMLRPILDAGAWDAMPEWLIQRGSPPKKKVGETTEKSWSNASKAVKKEMKKTAY